MASQLWLDAINGYAQLWGFPPDVMLIIVGVIYAIGMAALISKLSGGGKKTAYASFLLVIFIEVSIGLLDWIFIIIPVALAIGIFTMKDIGG